MYCIPTIEGVQKIQIMIRKNSKILFKEKNAEIVHSNVLSLYRWQKKAIEMRAIVTAQSLEMSERPACDCDAMEIVIHIKGWVIFRCEYSTYTNSFVQTTMYAGKKKNVNQIMLYCVRWIVNEIRTVVSLVVFVILDSAVLRYENHATHNVNIYGLQTKNNINTLASERKKKHTHITK